MSNRVLGKYNFDENKIESLDETVIYFNFFIHHWGHYLIDVISRLWYLLDKDIKNYKIAYTTILNENDEISGNYLELLNLFGIEKNQLIMINKPTKVKKIIIPEQSIYPGKYYTKEYKKIFDRIVENANVKFKNENKIYCSRKTFKLAQKKEIGENKIEKIFNDNGFISISFENLTVKQQIEVINSSKEIVAISGTLPHNILFARNNPKLIILNKTYNLNFHQFLINKLVNVDSTYIDIYISPLPVLYGNGPFILKTTNNFKNYCIDNNFKIEEEFSTILTIKEKIWYYMMYFRLNRKQNIKDEMFTKKEIRKLYKESQRKEEYYE